MSRFEWGCLLVIVLLCAIEVFYAANGGIDGLTLALSKP